jgi:hypothetical protein
MFADFDQSQKPAEGRGRMGVSYLISGGIFLAIFAALAATIATATVVVKRRKDVDVTFADLPPPPPPKPKPKVKKAAAGGKRKLAQRAALKAPKEIPEQQPEEAEGELGEAQDVGPVEGFVGGTGDGEGGGAPPTPAPPPPLPPAPPPPPAPLAEQETERITAPRLVSGCRTPEIPDALEGQASTILIEVRMLIDAQGKVASATIVRSHPLVPDDLILRCARAQVFQPARLPDGVTVPYPYRSRFVFKPAGA